MALWSNDAQVPLLVVAECQADLRHVVEALRKLGEITEMESWSYPIGVQHQMILDDLVALDAYLEILKRSSKEQIKGDESTPSAKSSDS